MYKRGQMDTKTSHNPRSVRARRDLLQALVDLLKAKTYSKITITDIANQAGLARHTFYNHYETKEELLHSLIDSILDKFFESAKEWDFRWDIINASQEIDRKVGVKFFEIWRDHSEVVEILNSVDIDCLLIARMKDSFERNLYDFTFQKGLDLNPALGAYLVNFNAYAFVGILRQWLKDDMKYPPEVMGEFLNHFAGVGLKRTAIDKFMGKIK